MTVILELTTVDEWNHVPMGDNPEDTGTRGLSATALFGSRWLRGPGFLRIPDWPIIPCTDVITEMKSRKFSPGTELRKNETHEMTTLTAHVTINASTFKWQNRSSYEKPLRILTYMLRIVQKFSSNRTSSASITDPDELLEAESRLFLLLQTESFSDLVWIVEATSPRGHYPLAHVLKLNNGSDAIARSADVRTMSGKLIRPIIKLAAVLPPTDPS